MAKEADDNDDNNDGSGCGYATWDFDDDKLKQWSNIEEGSHIEVILDLAKGQKSMEEKQRLHFLCLNFAGQDSNKNP